MEPVRNSPDLIAACGLYCGGCRKLRKGGCPGCRQNEKASWCKIRRCVQARGLASCAACADFGDAPQRCPTFNALIGRVFGLIFNSDRSACIRRIREVGADAFAREMSERELQTLPRRNKRA